MGKKDGKSSGDIEEGTHHSQLNEIDHDSLCFSDAEARSSRSPYGSNGNCRRVSAQEIDGFQEPSGKSVVSESSLGNDLENGVSEVKINVDRVEQDCRICHLSLEKAAPESGVPIELGCSCKDDLAAAHKQCAETWFKIKGNKICEICGSTARNVADLVESEPTEQWGEANSSTAPPAAPPSETRSFWQGHRFLKFLLACLVLAFVISWLFHFNVPGAASTPALCVVDGVLRWRSSVALQELLRQYKWAAAPQVGSIIGAEHEMEVGMKHLCVLALFLLVHGGGSKGAEGAGECGRVPVQRMALQLAPCASAAQDAQAQVSAACCSAVQRVGQNPACLCAVMLSDTAKSVGAKPEVAVTIPKRCNLANRPVGYECGGRSIS
ncbi:Protease inhibitor/seed storage/LTP family [Musa troglodytarum]|uniref:Protease inhibitor/seed storage/LTP family n=2 Tax=Musa troglodytarum TaxID=320322 RepID=A0A9E7LA53_9LILI|nr:Protease inhibitor/seed storage/LTP family [Musa troglodytarum]